MKTITKLSLSLATLLTLSSSTLFAEENLIQNGSFEDFTVLKDGGKWKKVTLDNWKGTSKVWTDELGKDSTDGLYKLTLDGRNTLDVLSQELVTVAGGKYKLSLDVYAKVEGSSDVQILLDGTVIETLTPSLDWENYEVTFVGTGETQTLSLREEEAQNSRAGAVIDNLVLTLQAVDLAQTHAVATQGDVPYYATEHTASLVIDGNNSTYGYTNGNSDDNWLQVAFPKAVKMSKVVVVGSSYRPDRLEGATVYVSSEAGIENLANAKKIGTLNGTALEQSFSIDEKASYIFIKALDSNKLHIATVEVYGSIIDNIAPTVDIAQQYGVATQADKNGYSYYSSPDNVLDGDDSTYNHTQSNQTENWVQVELPSPTKFSKLMIQSRTGNTFRVEGASVYISDEPYSSGVKDEDKVGSLKGDSSKQYIEFDSAKSGTYLIVKAKDSHPLHLVTIEAYGELPATPEFRAKRYMTKIDKWHNKTQTLLNMNVVDYQNDALTYRIDGDMPFRVDKKGNLLVDGLLAVQNYEIDVIASDGTNSVTQRVVVKVKGTSIIKEPFRTVLTSPELSGYLPNTYNDGDTLTIMVQGQSYESTVNLDGTWSIDEGTVSALPIGLYDITLVIDEEEILYSNFFEIHASVLKKSEFNLAMNTIANVAVTIKAHNETALNLGEKVRGTSISLKVENSVTTLENKSYREIKSLLGSYVDASGSTVFVKLNFNQNILPYSTNTLTSFAHDTQMKIVPTANMFDMEFSFGGSDCSEGIGSKKYYYCQPTDIQKENYGLYLSMYNHFYNSVNGLSVMKAWVEKESYKTLNSYSYTASNYFSDKAYILNYYYRNIYDVLIPNMSMELKILKGWGGASGLGSDVNEATLFGDKKGEGYAVVRGYNIDNLDSSGAYQFIHHEMYHGLTYNHSEGMTYGWSDTVQNAARQLDSYTIGKHTVIDVPNYIVESQYIENNKIQLTVHKTSNATQSDVTFEVLSSSGFSDSDAVVKKAINDGANQVTFTTQNSLLARNFIRVYASDSDEVMSLFIRPSNMTKTKLVSSNTKTYHAISNADWKRSTEVMNESWKTYKSPNICQAWFGGDARTASLAEADFLHDNYQAEIDGIDWLDSKKFVVGENDSVGFKVYDYTQNAYVKSSIYRYDLVTDDGLGILCVESLK